MPCTESAWKWPANRVLARRRALWRACADGESKRPGLSMKSMRCPASRKADSVPERGLLAISGPIPCMARWVAWPVVPYGASNRMAGRTARCDVPRRESRALRVRRVLPRCAALRAPRSVDPSHCVPHIPPPRCVLRAQRTCRVTSRLVARRSPHPADLSRTSRSADLSHRVPRPAAVRCALPACVATAQSTARSSRRPSRSGCPRNR